MTEETAPALTPMHAAARDFGHWLRMRNYSESTISSRGAYLRDFAAWCEERSVESPVEVTRPVLERYRHHIYMRRKSNGEPLSFRTQYLHLHTLRKFFSWLVRQGHLGANPASELEMPKLEWRLPKAVLSAEEVELVMRQPNLLDPQGLRDRAILEVLYSTGSRRTELCTPWVWDVDVPRGTLFIRQGKGKRDRVVPIGERALAWVVRYRDEVRPLLVYDLDEQHLFLNKRGDSVRPMQLGVAVTEYLTAAGLDKRGSCHLFRHTCATLMLEGGADVRFVQEMLGHASIASTQVYTHVSITKLKQVHTATHPGALPRRAEQDRAADDVALVGRPVPLRAAVSP